jgi:hypothetical protein
VRCQHRLDFGAQRLVGAARVLEEGSALTGIAQQRFVKHSGNLLPALGRHLCVLGNSYYSLGPEHPLLILGLRARRDRRFALASSRRLSPE